ncbi:MAG: hypothetical protein EA397_02265 [Deltaproteobacteria bacterium]|nr:MAG: hypothetical protein EA397_02265 [Deltaproteobacteria bacterium]
MSLVLATILLRWIMLRSTEPVVEAPPLITLPSEPPGRSARSKGVEPLRPARPATARRGMDDHHDEDEPSVWFDHRGREIPIVVCEVFAPEVPDRHEELERISGPAPENAILQYNSEGRAFSAGGLLGGGVLEFGDYQGFNQAHLLVDGFQPTSIRWEDGRCTAPIRLEPAAIVEGIVTAPEGDPAYGEFGIQGTGACAQSEAMVEEDGTFLLYVPPGPCRLRIMRIFRGGIASTRYVEVDARLDHPTTLHTEGPEVTEEDLEGWSD